MATEELIVLLDAKTAKLDAKLRATEQRLDDLDGSTKKNDKSLFSFSKTAKAAGGVILKVAAAAVAVNAAITAMVLSSAKGRKELEQLSRQAKTSTENFQSLAFATSQYGVNAEQIADISKDISDKVAEFSIAGTGAFQDYADTIKLTKEEAREAAKEFTTMSSEEVIGKMISEMEKAGVSASDMTFALESMGNDLSKLQPLFSGNSAELTKLKSRFDDVNSSLQITDQQAEGLREVSTSFELMTSQLGNATTAISATLAPVMDDFFNDVINIVPEATQTVIDFANSFLDAENISSQAGVLKELENSSARIVELKEEASKIEEQDVSFRKDGGANQQQLLDSIGKSIELEKIRTEELSNQLRLLEDQRIKIEDAKTLQGGEIGGETGDGVSTGGTGTGDQIAAIENRFKSEEELLVQKLERELEIIGDNDTLKAELEEEFFTEALERQAAFEAEKAKISADTAKKEDKIAKNKAKTEQKIEDQKLALAGRTAQTLLSQGLSSQQKLFSIVKDSAASQIEAYGLTAGAKALAELGPIAGPPVSASYIGWSQVAAGVVRALPLSGGGGGGAGSPDAGGGAVTSTEQPSFERETSSLELTEATEGGSSQSSVPFATDSGDEIMDVIARLLNERKMQGID